MIIQLYISCMMSLAAAGTQDNGRVCVVDAKNQNNQAGTIHVLGNAALDIAVTGNPGSEYQWHLAYNHIVFRNGKLGMDKKGKSTLQVDIPDVRVRVECVLVLNDGDTAISRDFVIYPARGLEDVTNNIRKLRFGTTDKRILQALKDENVHCDDLDTRLQLDTFSGGGLFLGGYQNSDELTDVCQRLDSRVRGGMTVIVVNPPVNWKVWGVELKNIKPVKLPVRFADDFGHTTKSSDLGTGPRDTELCISANWKRLVWAEAGDKKQNKHHCLAATKQIGKGQVMAINMPCLNDPVANASGRALLDAIIFSILNKPSGKTGEQEEKNNEK